MDTQVATKDDVSKIKIELKADIKAVKADIKSVKTEVKSLRQDVLKVEERVENVETDLQVMNTKLDKIQNTMDKFLGVVDDLRTDNTVGAHHTRELQIKVAEHEERLKRVESSVG